MSQVTLCITLQKKTTTTADRVSKGEEKLQGNVRSKLSHLATWTLCPNCQRGRKTSDFRLQGKEARARSKESQSLLPAFGSLLYPVPPERAGGVGEVTDGVVLRATELRKSKPSLFGLVGPDQRALSSGVEKSKDGEGLQREEDDLGYKTSVQSFPWTTEATGTLQFPRDTLERLRSHIHAHRGNSH